MYDSDDEPIALSSHALAALQAFKDEENSRLQQFEKLYKASEEKFDETKDKSVFSIDTFQEDWQLSQFWYSDETANKLADALLEGATETTVICIASAPSVYAAIKQRDESAIPTKHIYLLEYDNRFKLLAGDKFGFYDYNDPLNVPEAIRGKCDRLLIDPPFLEEECQTKSALTTKELMNKDTSDYRLISCTGERMRDIVVQHYPNVQVTDFHPEHKNGLSNEFACYASFEWAGWSFE